jgi:hypothetical protein
MNADNRSLLGVISSFLADPNHGGESDPRFSAS